MAKHFPHQMANKFHIYKWIFFAISTIAIIGEIAFRIVWYLMHRQGGQAFFFSFLERFCY